MFDEILNGLSMIPGFYLISYWYSIYPCNYKLYDSYKLLCINSMIYHLTNAYTQHENNLLLKLDFITQLNFTYSVVNNDYVLYFILCELLLNFNNKYQKWFGYLLNIINIIRYSFYLNCTYEWKLLFKLFITNFIYKNKWSHTCFHILLHYNIYTIFKIFYDAKTIAPEPPITLNTLLYNA
jgi:hypothetical protein